ncbi:nucleoside phosphorylase [Shewanella yunxiaonensis]|uniref:Uridine phosphorylase n=1 Tax=Shewanella yunxiaonensis TaxID=2829809 RepID=A0ABX7YS91_9GAMM|nr:nucleoside phosphorylase [Shewanella yunxiaonensis]QUN05530.1 nucleoside phosphorylase [Shewanella yunxiaonensis]
MTGQPHILLQPGQVSERVILCGDPARVTRIASLLADAKPLASNREFTSVNGQFQGHPIAVCSTGIGAPSAIIALEELIKCGGRQFIRVGSAGALQPQIALGDLIVAEAAVRDDGGSASYAPVAYPALANRLLVNGLSDYLQQYLQRHHLGIVRSHDSFYTDQELAICRQWHKLGVLAADMETAALFTVGRLRDVAVASVLNNVVLYGEHAADGINDYVAAETIMMQGEQLAARAALAALCQ